MTIGARIKARRQELKLSQRELAAQLGYTDHTTLTRIEAGKVDLPQSRLMKIAKVLGVTPGYLIGSANEEDSQKNSQLAKLAVRLRTDEAFYKRVAALAELSEKQLQGVDQLIAAFKE